jgi:hypothetical protein
MGALAVSPIARQLLQPQRNQDADDDDDDFAQEVGCSGSVLERASPSPLFQQDSGGAAMGNG